MQDPLVFLPGMMCDARLFAPQVADLGRVTSVTIAPTTHGERIEEIASNLLDQLPLKFALVGQSIGGVVAMELLRRAPDRVTRMALINTSSLAETPQSAAEYEPFIIKLRAGSLEETVRAMMPSEHLAPGPDRAQIMAQLIEMARDIGAEAIVRQLRAMQRRRDYQSVLRRCKVPALVLCGKHDAMMPVKRHSFMAELIPNAQLHVFETAGHLPTLECPVEVSTVLMGWLMQPQNQPARVAD
ncbi:Hydrolase, alpha/beta fold family [hydrothermal vent metagenome]|uniref:Hydrolase, alpha/beta fold family n=1 Tax=hydrothermal vent metagenome TaxID=652676 RepID=A0A3B0RSV1_9ZZZZ